jgi:hypothetical protein
MRKEMRQKYEISKNIAKGNLTIKEYAIIEKSHKKSAFSTRTQEESFAFLHEETYDSEMLVDSIAKGLNSLIASIRTLNMFPVKPNARKIAESIVELYNSSEDGTVEIFFDDVDLMPNLI